LRLARRPGLSPVASALEITDGGLGLDSAQWQTTWFGGGIQPGVVIYTYLATTNTRHSYVVAVLAGNLSAPSTRPHDADRAVSDQGSTHAGRTELIAALPGLQ
jgi:hypothetical protein